MKYFIADAFASEPFKGNPAGVCLTDSPLSEDIMQKISFENNLAETAFVTKKDGWYDLRWFTPEVEIDLCGHATLATAFVLMNYTDIKDTELVFHTISGILKVRRDGNTYQMDFPSRKPVPCEIPAGLEEALGAKVLETHLSRDVLVLLENEAAVRNLKPNIPKLMKIKDPFAFIVTAKGDHYDFVSRFFAPNAGIVEDPVTGSSHSTLIPFWSERLNKSKMTAAQLSQRGGILYCEDKKDRVEIGGKAVCYMVGEIVL